MCCTAAYAMWLWHVTKLILYYWLEISLGAGGELHGMAASSPEEEDTVLSLAYRGLTELPRELIPRISGVRYLDLSYNEFSYPLISCHSHTHSILISLSWVCSVLSLIHQCFVNTCTFQCVGLSCDTKYNAYILHKSYGYPKSITSLLFSGESATWGRSQHTHSIRTEQCWV